MSYKEAILTRRSRRSYINRLPSVNQVVTLREMIEGFNEKEGFNIQLMVDDSSGFDGITSSYGLFSGVRNYIALVGNKDIENIHEKLGYFGEQLVLTCEEMDLGTCWVGGTFKREDTNVKVAEDDVFVCVIVFGNVKGKNTIKENVVKKLTHSAKKTKAIVDLFYSEEEPPNWFIEGMRMVQRAPSAMNKMPAKFYYSDGSVYAQVKDPATIELYDLGIAKLHFEVGAEGGSWDFGNGGLFRKSHFKFTKKNNSDEGPIEFNFDL